MSVLFEITFFFKYRTSTDINIYARHFRASCFKNDLVHPRYRVQVTRSHPSFHRAICRRLSSSKDMIILALVSDKVTAIRRQNSDSQFQDDATDTITRREMDWPTSSEGRNASARKVTMITQTGTLETKKNASTR